MSDQEKLIERLRGGPSTSTSVTQHMRKYQALCDEAADALEVLSAGAPDHWALQSATDVHIGLWNDKATAEQMAEMYPGSTILPLRRAARSAS